MKGKTGEEILDTYNSERWPVAQKLPSLTDRLFSSASSFNPIIRMLLGVVFPLVGKVITRVM
ncbi:hypothetical protein [Bdellovibrio sp. HCB288]|uniref:hypothetical protein n=1 Tax=Bdellovibrio sp. HCB288 TaxID=3394355 RepID=UPI0039B5E41A